MCEEGRGRRGKEETEREEDKEGLGGGGQGRGCEGVGNSAQQIRSCHYFTIIRCIHEFNNTAFNMYYLLLPFQAVESC